MTLTHTPFIDQLLEQGVIKHHHFEAIARELRRGATLLSALTAGPEARIWAHLARRHGLPHYPQHTDLKVLFADLIPHHLALTHQILPHRTRGHDLQVLTYTHTRPDGPSADFPGLTLRHTLVTPTVWRRAYRLCYPEGLVGRLSETQATALVTLTPLGEAATTTPEQRAEITALTSGLQFIDLHTHPIDEAVIPLVTLAMKALTHSYPHHLEGRRLVVLMVDPHDQDALARLRAQTQREILPAITTAETIQHLLDVDSLTHEGE